MEKERTGRELTHGINAEKNETKVCRSNRRTNRWEWISCKNGGSSRKYRFSENLLEKKSGNIPKYPIVKRKRGKCILSKSNPRSPNPQSIRSVRSLALPVRFSSRALHYFSAAHMHNSRPRQIPNPCKVACRLQLNCPLNQHWQSNSSRAIQFVIRYLFAIACLNCENQ